MGTRFLQLASLTVSVTCFHLARDSVQHGVHSHRMPWRRVESTNCDHSLVNSAARRILKWGHPQCIRSRATIPVTSCLLCHRVPGSLCQPVWQPPSMCPPSVALPCATLPWQVAMTPAEDSESVTMGTGANTYGSMSGIGEMQTGRRLGRVHGRCWDSFWASWSCS